MDYETIDFKHIDSDDILSKDDFYINLLIEKEYELLYELLSLDAVIKDSEFNIY